MPILQATNDAVSTLAGPVSNTSPIIILASGSGSLFPSPINGQYFALILNDQATGLTYEYCYCVQRVGDVLTVLRGQEGSSALTWQAGDAAVCGMTAGQLQQMAQVFYFTGSNPNGSVAGTAATPPVGGIPGFPPSFCWAAAAGNLWGCTQTGPAATAVWSLFAGPYTDNFQPTDSNNPGYRISPDGYIEQWGKVVNPGTANTHVNFPISFPNARMGVIVQNRSESSFDENLIITVGIGAFEIPNPLNAFLAVCINPSVGAPPGTPTAPGHFTWFAWGY
jgi:hypothetical protein